MESGVDQNAISQNTTAQSVETSKSVRLDPSKTVCRYRWSYPLVNLESGEVKTCCHTPSSFLSREELAARGADAFLNNEYQRERRKEMLQGIRHSDCNYCWRMEDKGIKSPRQGPELTEYMNEFGFPGSLAKIVALAATNSKVIESKNPLLLEIILGKACDQKCVYCSSHYSSAWELEDDKFLGHKTCHQNKAPTEIEPRFWEWFEQTSGSLEYISFIGGEPTFNPQFYDWLDKLDEIYTRHPDRPAPRIGIISNFNFRPQNRERLIACLKKMTKKFRIMMLASVDTMGARAEYIRSGLSWPRIEENIRAILALRLDRFEFTINPTINALSVTTMLSLLRFAKSLQDEYRFPVALGRNMVVDPDIFSPLVLPPEFAVHIEECVEFVRANNDSRYPTGFHGDWEMYVQFLDGIAKALTANSAPSPEVQRRLFDRLKELDRRRGTDFRKVFYDYHDFFNDVEATV